MSKKKARPCPFCSMDEYKVLFFKDGFKYVRCARCGQMYVAEILAENVHFQEEFYADDELDVLKEPEPLDAARSVRGQRMMRLIGEMRRVYGDRKDLRILDVGCGKGWHLAFLKSKGYSEARGVEVNKKVAQAARKRGLQIDEGFLEDQKYPEGSFDVVLMDQVIEHLESPLGVVHEVFRILRRGGIFWASVPNIDAWHIRLWLKEKHRHFDGTAHLNYFTCATLARLLESAGFKVKRSGTFIEEATVQRIKGVLLSPGDFDNPSILSAKGRDASAGSARALPRKSAAKARLKKAAAVLASPLNALLVGLTRASNAGAYIEITAQKNEKPV